VQNRNQQALSMDKAAPDPLQAIRSRIDAIDEAMHRLLIERSGVVAELIEVKGTREPGAAFRPDREAEMMRRLVMRHAGDLPLVTVEHIWREIITTFTAMQAPFGIAAGPASDPLALRDTIRFYFGFSIQVTACDTAESAIARVASGRELAVMAAEADRWWDSLAAPQAPKIFAKLPFIELPSRPADLPAYVIGPPMRDVGAPDIRVFAVADAPGIDDAVAAHEGRVAGRSGDDVLLELPWAATLDDIGRDAGVPLDEVRELGGFAQPIRYLSRRTA
jgi:chorismate mutase-like protein